MKRILLTCLLLTACTSDPAPRVAAPSPSPVPSAVATTRAPADPDDLLLAVVRRSGGLELHRVDRTTRTAALERVLAPPQAGARALDVALGGAEVCAAWHAGPAPLEEDPSTTVACYPVGASEGVVVEGPAQPVHVALSADGTRLAWAEHTPGGNQVVGVGRRAGRGLTAVRRFSAQAGRPAEAFTGTGVTDLAWLDADEVAISTGVESDDGPDLLRFDVATAGDRGWLDGRPVRTPTRGYLTYDRVASISAGEALAVERGSYLDESRPPSRAVRVDLADGAVLDVLATAAEGRDVVGVSGSREAAVYVTAAGDGPRKAYLRLAGEPRGTTITGLPDDAEQVVTTGRSG